MNSQASLRNGRSPGDSLAHEQGSPHYWRGIFAARVASVFLFGSSLQDVFFFFFFLDPRNSTAELQTRRSGLWKPVAGACGPLSCGSVIVLA